MTEIIYLVEGETEEMLFKALPLLGKTMKFNLWQKPIRKIERKFKSDTKIYVVYDTDIWDNFDLFHQNIMRLKSSKRLLGIIQQTHNLENELLFACQSVKNQKQLFKAFNAVSADEFKTNFNATTNLAYKLDNLGFNPDLLWQQETDSRLVRDFGEYVKTYPDLEKKPYKKT